MARKLAIVVGIGFFSIALLIIAFGKGWFGNYWDAGTPEGPEVPSQVISERMDARADAASKIGVEEAKQILFGDLHVHSTFSKDAFTVALPLAGRDGAHPIAEACDFARYCSALDFWSINDHVFTFTQKQWQETKEAIRQCNAAAGDPGNPDVVSFLGWEWTQMGDQPSNHYGHKNVIFLETDEDKVPTRPIGAASSPASLQGAAAKDNPFRTNLMFSLFTPGGNRQAYLDYARYQQDTWDRKPCPEGVNVKDLPKNCYENVPTPKDLFRKLDEWETPSIVIPHGTTWGFYTPEGSSLDKQLKNGMHDPNRQFLIEIFSGHGNSEEYRPWREVLIDKDGNKTCPGMQGSYEPECYRAGQIIYQRCLSAGFDEPECASRRDETIKNYLAIPGITGFRTVPGYDVEIWGNAGQCPDCYLPAFNYRPRTSVQYALAITNFDDPENPQRFNFGIMGSSDNHSAKPGTGYKEVHRRDNIEFSSRDSEDIRNLASLDEEQQPYSIKRSPGDLNFAQFNEFERQASFFMTGGLIATHTAGRDRQSIWDAMQRKEVYATTGERILLWFDRIDDVDGTQMRDPMGSHVETGKAPRFRVRAVGAFKQLPGCPDYATSALTPERLERLCRGECFNPSDERKYITRIEVVRILPQSYPGEPLEGLIQDAWRSFPCDADRNGCTVEFEDPEYETLARDATYYVRAIQEPQPTINGDHLRCTFDESGMCIKVDPCYSDFRTDLTDDCRAMKEDRAWSSPIFLSYKLEE
ncbi:MAG: DUF3604 domain-containing protein [Alphaproteobacteria bacterium]|nr:MAG: DUF3604 domain-containing protein [Alphaproteobacteria bacterium]